MRILVIHGPNLNLLGSRQRDLYGDASLKDINDRLEQLAGELDVELAFFQSNIEGEIVDKIHESAKSTKALLINPAAYGHTSVAIRDALLAVDLPFVEVHMSNVYAREPFRHKTMLSDIAAGVVVGMGVHSYLAGLRGLVDLLT